MGVCLSKNTIAPDTRTLSTQKTSSRIMQVLAKKKGEVDKNGQPMSFEKILLRFEKLRVVIAYIKAIFKEQSKDKAGLNFEGLKEALRILHGPMERQEIAELFEFVDLDDSKIIEFKEFLVALTVGHVLNILPQNSTAAEGSSARQVNLTQVQGLTCKAEDIDMILNLIVSAYLLFDPKGLGHIDRKAVTSLICESSGKKNAMLSQQRWDEMDWDANGSIDFPEFVQAFSSWVDLEGEE